MPYGLCLNPRCHNELDDYGNMWCSKCRQLPFFRRLKIFKEEGFYNDKILQRGERKQMKEKAILLINYKKAYWDRRREGNG